MRAALLTGVFVILSRGSAMAQLAPTPTACANAAAAVDGVRLPAVADTSPGFTAWTVLGACGSVGNAAAARVLRSAALLTETDGARVVEFFKIFYARRSADLFDALRAAIRSGNASQPVKMQAIRALGGMYSTTYEFDSDYFTQQSPSYCSYRPSTVQISGDVQDLPPDYLARIVATMRDAENGANPTVVKGAGHCWRITLERFLPPDTKKVKLKHLCAQTFRVENSNPGDVRVSARVEGTSEQHTIIVAANSALDFSTRGSGHVLLFMNAVQIDQKHTASNQCG